MLLEFPSLQTLTLVLKSGLIPPAVAAAPCKAWPDGERWLVSTPAALDKAAVAALKTWKVTAKNKGAVPQDAAEFALLAQVIPLARDVGKIEVPDRLAVIFWLPSAALLEPFVQEILRQGNDRIALRSLTDSDSGEQVLVRVIGPPYYSLLHALEPDAAAPIRAYVERAPRVWVELGHSHPLATQMQPAAGQWLFLTSRTEPCSVSDVAMLNEARLRSTGWETIREAPFRDLYTTLELQLPQAPAELKDVEPAKLNVPLRLVRGGGYESPDLYVLHDRAIEQLDAFVQATSDQTIARLSFAVVEREPEPWVVLRVRPGKEKEPLELVFDGLACRSYLRIVNLFVPSGVRLHPPLRRDAIKDLLAADPKQIVWLQPRENGEFQPQSLPESGFHPLARWVEYILDREREPLTAWIRSTTFDFDDFICRDDYVPPPRERAEKEQREPSAPASASTNASTKPASTRPSEKEKPAAPKASQAAPKAPSEMQRQLRELEAQFLALTLPFDSPERTKLWHELALLNAVVGHHAEATQCFAHALWEEGTDQHWAAVEEWLLNETQATALDGAAALRELMTKKAINALTQLINLPRPSAQHGHMVAAFLNNWLQTAKHSVTPGTAIKLQTYFEKVEPLMSVRIAWLAWHALYRLSGDELMLARARDRILQRLHQQGLLADLELPLFLRSFGGGSEQGRTVREELSQLHELAQKWSDRNRGRTSEKTKGYIDLIFAFGFARLAEGKKAQDLLLSACGALHSTDVVDRWLYDAYDHRVSQLLAGEPPIGPLPARLLKELAALPTENDTSRYKIDRLRERSRILEPHEALNAYRHTTDRDGLVLKLRELPDILDAKVVQVKLREYWRAAHSPLERFKVLQAALQTSWRLDEPLTAEMLAHVPAMLAANEIDGEFRLKLLQLALLSAAHYDLHADVTRLLDELAKWLTPQSLKSERVLSVLEQTLTLVFQRLRKMGLRNEIGALLRRATEALHGVVSRGSGTPNELRMLLSFGGAALMLGDQTAWIDIDRACTHLLTEALAHEGDTGVHKQTQLSVAYLRAVGQGPLPLAIERYKEYFQITKGMRETSSVADNYSLKQLEVVETLVLSVTSDNFTMDRAARAWLDDEEFLIRRRIHADVRAALA